MILSLVFAAKKGENKTMNAFIFKSASYDPDQQNIELKYAYSNGPDFNEIIHFAGAKKDLNDAELDALNKTMRGLHLAAGISYYKAYCPTDIRIEGQPLAKEEADFFFKFYRHGLGEFSVENDIDLSGVIRFPVGSNHHPRPSDLTLSHNSVVPIGGGKDSIVSLEAIIAAKRPHRMIAINAKKPILDVMEVAGGDAVHINRTIDPALFALNDKGAMNGHVPITGNFVVHYGLRCGAL